jgi:signal transduction histidine kinase
VLCLLSSRDGRDGLSPRLRLALWPTGIILGVGAEWTARSEQSLAAAGADLAVGWAFIACGLIGWSLRPQSRVGVLLALTGFAWFLGTLAASDIGLIAAFGAATLTIHRGPLFHAIIGYPSGRLSGRMAFVAVTLGYVYAAIVPIARNDVVTIIVILLVVATTIRGYFLAAGPDRQARMTAVAAAAAVTLPLAGGSVGRLMGMGPDAERAVLWGYEAVLVLVAIGFLVDLLRGRWAQAAVTRLVVDLGEDSETGTLRARLAHTLGDRSLAIAYWLPEVNGYVDERGSPLVLPPVGSGRAVTVIERRGERIAALVHDATVLDDPGLIDAVASAARIALSNVRMQAEVRRQVAELDASRRRILAAGDAQRRRLQQELREGVGQRLAGVQEILDLALENARSAPDRAVTSGLKDAERELHAAQVELQELAAGIHPAVLTERGLLPALSSLVERAPCPVRLIAPPQRLPAVIETAIYFVCSEALTNVGKYARASRVDVVVRTDGDLVTLLIADDGTGGADPSTGSGLEGVADRIEALGGRLVVESPAGRGTRLLAEIPTARR